MSLDSTTSNKILPIFKFSDHENCLPDEIAKHVGCQINLMNLHSLVSIKVLENKQYEIIRFEGKPLDLNKQYLPIIPTVFTPQYECDFRDLEGESHTRDTATSHIEMP